jgi:hypothetical protein
MIKITVVVTGDNKHSYDPVVGQIIRLLTEKGGCRHSGFNIELSQQIGDGKTPSPRFEIFDLPRFMEQ